MQGILESYGCAFVWGLGLRAAERECGGGHKARQSRVRVVAAPARRWNTTSHDGSRTPRCTSFESASNAAAHQCAIKPSRIDSAKLIQHHEP